MAEYIDKKEAVKIAEFYGLARGSAISRHSAIADMIARQIEELPSAGVATVIHGKWAHLGGDEWCCTNCGFVITTEGSWEKPTDKYCSNCGAKMDLEG